MAWSAIRAASDRPRCSGSTCRKSEFVATATAIALLVDGARMPVYLAAHRDAVAAIWPLVLVATAGVVGGTLAGAVIFARVPQRRFRQVVGAAILLLGVATLWREVRWPG